MIKGSYTYQCSLCDNTSVQEWHQGGVGGLPMDAVCPEGWVNLKWALVCDLHDLTEITLADVLDSSRRSEFIQAQTDAFGPTTAPPGLEGSP